MPARNAVTARGPSTKENMGCFGGCFRPSHKATSRSTEHAKSAKQTESSEVKSRSLNLEDLHGSVVVYQTAVPDEAEEEKESSDGAANACNDDAIIVAAVEESLAFESVREDTTGVAVVAEPGMMILDSFALEPSALGQMESQSLESRGASDTLLQPESQVSSSVIRRGIIMLPAVSAVLTETGDADAPVRLDLTVNDDGEGADGPPQLNTLGHFVRAILAAFPFLPCGREDIDW